MPPMRSIIPTMLEYLIRSLVPFQELMQTQMLEAVELVELVVEVVVEARATQRAWVHLLKDLIGTNALSKSASKSIYVDLNHMILAA